MKKFKKTIVSLLVFMLLFVNSGFAAETSQPVQVNHLRVYSSATPEKVNEYAISNFELLISPAKQLPEEYGFNANEISNFTLGKGFTVYNLKDGEFTENNVYYFPVMYNGKIRAILSVINDPIDGCSATFGKDFADKLDKMQSANNKMPIIIFNNNGKMIAQDDSSDNYELASTYLKNEKKEAILGYKDNLAKIKKYNSIEIKDIKESIMYDDNSLQYTPTLYATTPTSKFLSVPIVTQKDLSGVPHGMCWAATVACITNYKKGTTLTAQTICATMGIGMDAGAIPSKASAAFANYGLSTSVVNSAISQTNIINYIIGNKPIYMDSQNPLATNAHATTLRGYSCSSSGFAISIMDSNTESYRTITCNSSGYYLFTEPGSGGTFKWAQSVVLN